MTPRRTSAGLRIGKAVGSLTVGNLHEGGSLWMLATGTGLAPFISILYCPDVCERFNRTQRAHLPRPRPAAAVRRARPRDAVRQRGDDRRVQGAAGARGFSEGCAGERGSCLLEKQFVAK